MRTVIGTYFARSTTSISSLKSARVAGGQSTAGRPAPSTNRFSTSIVSYVRPVDSPSPTQISIEERMEEDIAGETIWHSLHHAVTSAIGLWRDGWLRLPGKPAKSVFSRRSSASLAKHLSPRQLNLLISQTGAKCVQAATPPASTAPRMLPLCSQISKQSSTRTASSLCTPEACSTIWRSRSLTATAFRIPAYPTQSVPSG